MLPVTRRFEDFHDKMMDFETCTKTPSLFLHVANNTSTASSITSDVLVYYRYTIGSVLLLYLSLLSQGSRQSKSISGHWSIMDLSRTKVLPVNFLPLVEFYDTIFNLTISDSDEEMGLL